MDWKELDNALASRNARPPCLVCGSTDWSAAGKTIALITAEDGHANIDMDAANTEALLVGTVTCANCGFVRMHSLKTLELEN